MGTIASRSLHLTGTMPLSVDGALRGITQIQARRAQLRAARAVVDTIPADRQHAELAELLAMLGLMHPQETPPPEPEPAPPRPAPPGPDPADWWWAHDPDIPGGGSAHLVHTPTRRRACNRRDPADDGRDWQPADRDHERCRSCLNTNIARQLAPPKPATAGRAGD